MCVCVCSSFDRQAEFEEEKSPPAQRSPYSQSLIIMATLQPSAAFSLRTGFGPSQIKGPSGKGWSRGRGIYRRDRLRSDCKARAENGRDGPAEQKRTCPELKDRAEIKKQTETAAGLWRGRDLLELTEIQLLLSLNERTFCNKSDLHITLNEFCTGFDPRLDFYAFGQFVEVFGFVA